MARFFHGRGHHIRALLRRSFEEAVALGHHVGTEHLLLAIASEESPAGEALRAEGVTPERIRDALRAVPPEPRRRFRGPESLGRGLRRALRRAVEEGGPGIGSGQVLLALLDLEDSRAAALVRDLGADPARIRERLRARMPQAARPAPRDTVLSVRIDDRDREAIDTLIEAGIHATRSEAAARLIRAGIEANAALFERVRATVGEIRRLRDQAQTLFRGAADESAE